MYRLRLGKLNKGALHVVLCSVVSATVCVLLLLGVWLWNDSAHTVTSVTVETTPLHKVECVLFDNIEVVPNDLLNDDSLLTPRLIYFPRIAKTGSTTIYSMFRSNWLPHYFHWKLRKFANDFLVKNQLLFTKRGRKKRLARIHSMLSAIDKHSKVTSVTGTKGTIFGSTTYKFNTHFGSEEQGFAEMGDGCAHTGGNRMIKRRALQLAIHVSNAWEQKLEWLQTAERLLVDGLFEATIPPKTTRNSLLKVPLNERRAAIRKVMGNSTLEIPFMFYAHFTFLKTVEEWMRFYVAPFPFQQLVTFRQPTARITSQFNFERLAEHKSERTEILLKMTKNMSLLQCAEDLDNALSNALPNARSDPYDTCHMPVNMQLKLMCGDLEHCPCSDVMDETHVELAINTTLEHFDFIGFMETMSEDIVEMRQLFFDDVPESEWEIVLPTPTEMLNKHGKNKTADDLEAANILTRTNRAEIAFYERLYAAVQSSK